MIDWREVQRELITNDAVRALCGSARTARQDAGARPIIRRTLLAWRRDRAFPAPVLELQVRGQLVELWARSEVQAWLREQAIGQRAAELGAIGEAPVPGQAAPRRAAVTPAQERFLQALDAHDDDGAMWVGTRERAPAAALERAGVIRTWRNEHGELLAERR